MKKFDLPCINRRDFLRWSGGVVAAASTFPLLPGELAHADAMEKARSDWASPPDRLGIAHWMGDLFKEEKKHPDHVFYSTLGDEVWLKSQDQKIETFETSEVDVAIVDEEMQDEAFQTGTAACCTLTLDRAPSEATLTRSVVPVCRS